MKLHIADSALELHFTFPKWHGLNKWFDHLVTDLYTGKKKKEMWIMPTYSIFSTILKSRVLKSFLLFLLLFKWI